MFLDKFHLPGCILSTSFILQTIYYLQFHLNGLILSTRFIFHALYYPPVSSSRSDTIYPFHLGGRILSIRFIFQAVYSLPGSSTRPYTIFPLHLSGSILATRFIFHPLYYLYPFYLPGCVQSTRLIFQAIGRILPTPLTWNPLLMSRTMSSILRCAPMCHLAGAWRLWYTWTVRRLHDNSSISDFVLAKEKNDQPQ